MQRVVDVGQQGLRVYASVQHVETRDQVDVLHLADVVDDGDVLLPQAVLHDVRSLRREHVQHDVFVELQQRLRQSQRDFAVARADVEHLNHRVVAIMQTAADEELSELL